MIRIRKNASRRGQAGQSIVETILMMPVLLLFLLNAVNFGYFFLVVTNLAAAPRVGVEYSIMGGATPAAIELPANGPSTNVLSSSFLTYEDMRGALNSPTTKAAVRFVRRPKEYRIPGQLQRRPGAPFGPLPAGHTFPAAGVDPELNATSTAPAFVLNQVT